MASAISWLKELEDRSRPITIRAMLLIGCMGLVFLVKKWNSYFTVPNSKICKNFTVRSLLCYHPPIIFHAHVDQSTDMVKSCPLMDAMKNEIGKRFHVVDPRYENKFTAFKIYSQW
jgi:hypothetical protein